jgi:hypothetical protein
MENSLIPLVIHKIKDPDGLERFRAASSFEEVMQKPSLGKEMIEIQEAYARLIENCKTQLKTLESSRQKRGDPFLKWKLAKTIADFIKSVEHEGYHFANSSKALSRDLKISVRQVNYLIEFAKTYPKRKFLHQQISWDKYKEILDIKDRQLQEQCIQKILEGFLKTRDDVRKFKKLKT